MGYNRSINWGCIIERDGGGLRHLDLRRGVYCDIKRIGLINKEATMNFYSSRFDFCLDIIIDVEGCPSEALSLQILHN